MMKKELIILLVVVLLVSPAAAEDKNWSYTIGSSLQTVTEGLPFGCNLVTTDYVDTGYDLPAPPDAYGQSGYAIYLIHESEGLFSDDPFVQSLNAPLTPEHRESTFYLKLSPDISNPAEQFSITWNPTVDANIPENITSITLTNLSDTSDTHNLLTAGSAYGTGYNVQGSIMTAVPRTYSITVKYRLDPPVANFSVDNRTPLEGETVTFTDTSTNTPTKWNWSFGDGATSTDQHPTHAYLAAGTYTVSLTSANDGGSDTETKTDYITVTAEEVPSTFFILNENLATGTQNDTLNAGTHTGEYGYYMTIINGEDASQSDSILEHISCSIETPDITDYGWPDYGVQDGNLVAWTFPDSFDLCPGELLSTGASTSRTGAMDYSATLARTTNRTLFTEPGVEHFAFTITFDDLNFVQSWGRISYPDSDNVTACKVPYTINSDAPVSWAFGNDQDQFIFNQSTLSSGVPYHFSVDIAVDPDSPVIYKPQLTVWTISDTTKRTLPKGTTADVPVDMLPDNVVSAAAGSDTRSDWELTRNDHQIGTLLCVIEEPTFGYADFTANVTSGVMPLTVQFTDLSTGTPTGWNWNFGDGTSSTDHNPTHQYTSAGNYTVCLTADGCGDCCTKPAYIKITPVLFGDANGDKQVNQVDTLRVLKEVVGLTSPPTPASGDVFTQTDVHKNGVIDVGDAMFIAQYNVGLRGPWFELTS